MIAATSNPKVWRVEFEQLYGELTKLKIVCFVYIGGNGVRIYYSHHVSYSCQVPGGAWEYSVSLRHTLNSALRSAVETGVWGEIWECVRDDQSVVRVFPLEIDALIDKLEEVSL